MQSQWPGPSESQSLQHLDVIVSISCCAASRDFPNIAISSLNSENGSRDLARNQLTSNEFDICLPHLSGEKSDGCGGIYDTLQEYSEVRDESHHGDGGLYANDRVRYGSEVANEAASAKLRKSCLISSDRQWGPAEPAEDSESPINDPRQGVISFVLTDSESDLIAEAKRLREQHHGASSPAAVLIGSELLRRAIAEAQRLRKEVIRI